MTTHTGQSAAVGVDIGGIHDQSEQDDGDMDHINHCLRVTGETQAKGFGSPSPLTLVPVRRSNETMKRSITTVFLCLLLAPPAWAGYYEGVSAYYRGDIVTTLREFRPLTEQDIATAQYNLGIMYHKGQGVPQDYAKAMKWYRKAAERGHVRGQYNVGVMYHKGLGLPQDYAKAAKWYRKAAEQGYHWGQNNLGTMYDKGQGVPQDYAE